MNELNAHIQEEVHWFMLFANGIVWVDVSRDGDVKLES